MDESHSNIFIISGPSRVGKDAIVKAVLQKKNLNVEKLITATTRDKRKGEVHGRDYYFYKIKEFEQKIEAQEFLEWARLRGGKYFGILLDDFNRLISSGKSVIMNIDVQGARRVTELGYKVVKIFIKPDSIARLKKRMKTAGFSEKEVKARMEDIKRELKEAKSYDYVVVNKEGKLNEAIAEVAEIIRMEIKKSKFKMQISK